MSGKGSEASQSNEAVGNTTANYEDFDRLTNGLVDQERLNKLLNKVLTEKLSRWVYKNRLGQTEVF